jgi:hypothetical protein
MLDSNGTGGLKSLQDSHSASSARFKATSSAMKLLKFSAGQMADLVKSADMVSPEDVIKAAGKMVSRGSTPENMATTLASMPTQPGEQLAAWVKQRAEGLEALSAQAAQAHEQARHGLGVDALREIIGHTVDGHMAQGQGDGQNQADPAQGLGAAPPGALGAPQMNG